jgi:hypothetical protein
MKRSKWWVASVLLLVWLAMGAGMASRAEEKLRIQRLAGTNMFGVYFGCTPFEAPWRDVQCSADGTNWQVLYYAQSNSAVRTYVVTNSGGMMFYRISVRAAGAGLNR